MRTSALVCVLALGSASGVGAGFGAHYVVPEAPLVRGVYVGERRAPDGVSPATWLTERREATKDRPVVLRLDDGRIFKTTLADLGFEIDVAATIAKAERVGHAGSPWRRVAETVRARRGRIDVPLVWFFDRDKAASFLATLAPSVRIEPTDARLDLKNRAKIDAVPGREIDVEATLEALARAEHEEEETVPLATKPVAPRVTLEELTKVDVEHVLSTYETTFATYGVGVGRSVNIKNAASKIDGLVIPAGAVFSFNDVVGPRSLDNGFALAPEIMGDEMTTGVGGGTCQVSSTLHVAALFGALEILERQSHSRPSSYTQMGLDATVSFPTVDLKIRNSMPFAVMIHAFVPEPTKELDKRMHRALRVELLGGEPVAKVEYRFGIGRAEDFTRRIYVKSFLPPGKRIKHQKGTRGYDVTSLVTLRFFDGRVEERSYFSGYRPAPEVFWVAPGYDEKELPPLPDHAKGVEDRTGRETAAL